MAHSVHGARQAVPQQLAGRPHPLVTRLTRSSSQVGHRTGSRDHPDVLVDYDALDLRFRDGVEGMPDIPFASIGLYLDEHRTSMPDKASYRRALREFYREERTMPGTTRRLDTAPLVEEN